MNSDQRYSSQSGSSSDGSRLSWSEEFSINNLGQNNQLHPLDNLSGEALSQITNPEIKKLVEELNRHARARVAKLGLQSAGSFDLDSVNTLPRNPAKSYPFVDPTPGVRFLQKFIFVFCVVSVFSEATDYPVFQTMETYKGYHNVAGVPRLPSLVLSIIFAAIFDTYVNVRAENIANDAYEVAVNIAQPSGLPTSIMGLMVFSQLCSLVSFLVGACGGMIGLMVLFQLKWPNASDQAYTVVLLCSAVFNIPTGLAYYAVFNIDKFKQSFSMFVDRVYAKEVRLGNSPSLGDYISVTATDLTLFNSRTIASTIESLFVILFRSISFVGIAAESLNIIFRDNPDKALAFWVSIIAFITTAVSVLTTRVLPVVSYYSKYEYLMLSDDDLREGRDKVKEWKPYLAKLLINERFFIWLLASVGLGLLLNHSLGMDSVKSIAFVCIPPVIMFCVALHALHELVYLNAAVKEKGNDAYWKCMVDNLKNLRKTNWQSQAKGQASPLQENLLDQNQQQAVSNNGQEKDLEERGQDLSKDAFKLLASSFENDWWIKHAVPVCVLLQVAGARGISFLSFNQLAEDSVHISFHVWGLFLLLGPINMLNWYDMFTTGAQATLLSRRAESYVQYAREQENAETRCAYADWKPQSKCGYYWNLFTKGGVHYETADVVRALLLKDKNDGPQPASAHFPTV